MWNIGQDATDGLFCQGICQHVKLEVAFLPLAQLVDKGMRMGTL